MRLGDDSDVNVVAVQVGGEVLDGVRLRQRRSIQHVHRRRWVAGCAALADVWHPTRP